MQVQWFHRGMQNLHMPIYSVREEHVCVGTVHATELKNNTHIASAACP